MSSQFWTTINLLLKFALTVASPVFLFGGIACFSFNEIYIWYMMHSQSLIAAGLSFLCIVMLYVLAIPAVFTVFEAKQDKGYPPHPPVHEHDMNHEHHHEDRTLAALLALTLQKQTDLKESTKESNAKDEVTTLSKSSLYMKQVEDLHRLKENQSLTEDEYELMKKFLIKKLTTIFEND